MSIRHPIAVMLFMIMAMSLIWSKALLSIIMVPLAIITVIDVKIDPFRIHFLFKKLDLKSIIRYKPFICVFALFWLLYMISILYAGNLTEWWHMSHPKFAFLLIPMCFAFQQPFSRKEYMLITLCMIMMAVWSSIWVQVAYFSDYELFNSSLGYGASLPTPGSHIRFSVIVAISMILCLGFAIENWKVKFAWERWAYAATAVYLFYFLHILSVRSGLTLAYAGSFILAIFYLRRVKVWIQFALAFVVLAAPLIAYETLSGLKQKVDYTLYDLGKFREGKGDEYSDSQRWESWRAGIMIGNQHPFFGIGTGKFRSALEDYYKSELKDYSWRPQNEWINVFAIFGLLGLGIFLFMILYPMTFSFFWKPPLLPTLYIIQLISMVVEHSLDSEVGTFLFLMLTLLGLSYQDGLDGSIPKKTL
ncbi:MAG: O-antigen ligase family protein [Saprospiraceae bacterium]